MFSNKVYDVLKWAGGILLPAIATMYLALANLWSLPYGNEVSATIMILVVFLSTILELSKTQYNKEFFSYELPRVAVAFETDEEITETERILMSDTQVDKYAKPAVPVAKSK